MSRTILELQKCTGTPNYNSRFNTIKIRELKTELKKVGIEESRWYAPLLFYLSDKHFYTKEIRMDIKDRKKRKKGLSRHDISKSRYQYLTRKLKKVDKFIDFKIADYNSQAIRQKIGRHGTISKQDFWKVKKKLVPCNAEVLSSLTGATGDQITDR